MPYRNLEESHAMTFLQQRLGFFLSNFDIQKNFCREAVGLVYREKNFIRFRLLRSNVEIVDDTFFKHASIYKHRPSHLIIAQIAEEIFVEHLHSQRFSDVADGLHPNVLILIRHFVGVGIQLAVGADDTVIVEVVVGIVVVVVVAAVGIVDFVQFGIRQIRHLVQFVERSGEILRIDVAVKGLIDEVPNVTTLILRIFADEFPIFLQSTARVTHRVVVFALNQRLCQAVVFAVSLTLGRRAIHRAVDVGVPTRFSCLFPLARTRLVSLFHPFVGCLEVRSVHRLVAERPHDDRRMVEMRRHVVLIALENLLGEGRFLGLGIVAILETVTFLIGLSRDVKPVFVAKVVPNRVVGIVARAHGVDVQSFHNLNVLNHPLTRHDIATVGVDFVAIRTLD